MMIFTEKELIQFLGPIEVSKLKAELDEQKLKGYRPILSTGTRIKVQFGAGVLPINGEILKTHIAGEKITYDLSLSLADDELTRAYNIESKYVSENDYSKYFSCDKP